MHVSKQQLFNTTNSFKNNTKINFFIYFLGELSD